jgi:hypothetical protein
MTQNLIIDCPHCAVRIKSQATAWIGNGEEKAFFLLECSTCHNALFGSTYAYKDQFGDWEWDTVERLWPAPTIADVGPAIPKAARRDIQDAQKCFSHGIYSATTVLCGRALERLIKEKVGAHMIGKGLTELKNKGIIDERLFSWAEALRKERNIGAHASEEDTTKENAQDIVDFTIAIFDYVYTLSEKYEEYIKRKSQKNSLNVLPNT